jgi:signal transduction histidine kinase
MPMPSGASVEGAGRFVRTAGANDVVSVRARGTLPLKTSLLIGFGLTVGIWVFAGTYFGNRVAALDGRASEVSQRYVRAQEALVNARTQVLLGSVHLRDALLDPERASAEERRALMIGSLEAAGRSLAGYTPVLNLPDERARIDRLLGEIGELRRTMLEMLAIDSSRWASMAGAFLEGQLTPRRQAFMNVADELGTLNRTAFVEHQVLMAQLYRSTQRQIWQVLGLALAASLGIAAASTLMAGRLERQVKEQHARDIALRQDLQRLSSELIRVREDERRGIARELHDDIGQLLTAIKFELAVVQSTVDEHGGPPQLLDDVRPIVEQTLQSVRGLSHLLHPAVLDDLGLTAALDLHIKEFRRRHSMRVDFTESRMEHRVSREIETAVYRIVQEALTNVAKHAATRSCQVSLVRLARALVVVVRDEGVGFLSHENGPHDGQLGLGLVSMRERATQVGGTVVVESAPGRGTRVVVDIPLDTSTGTGAAQPALTIHARGTAASHRTERTHGENQDCAG